MQSFSISHTLAESEAMLPDGFPAGLRVFIVDEDSVGLRMLEKMLLQCDYKVTISDCPFQALELLRANICNYDMVLIDVNLTCIDGFQLIEIVCREINLPVIVLSVNSDFGNVMTSIKYGATDYLVKPVRLEELKVIWKHVVKKSLNEKNSINESRSMDANISHLTKKSKNLVRKRDENDDIALKDNLVSQKKARVSWTPELHAKFINAVNQLGIDQAVPMKILDIMGISGLTRENVASHLQKYRKSLKRNTIEFDQQIFDNAKTRRDSESQQLGWTTESYMMNMPTQFLGYQFINQSLNQLDCQAQSYENLWTSNCQNEFNPNLQVEGTIKHDATDKFLNNNHNDNNNSDELATLLPFEQKQQQNSSDSSAQINTDSIDVQSFSLEDHGGSNTSNVTILSEFDYMDDTDELYIALSQFQY